MQPVQAALAAALALVVFLLQLPVVQGAAPQAWVDAAAVGDLLLADAEPDKHVYMPVVGNGFVGTRVLSNSTYVNGVYNGRGRGDWDQHVYPSHGARLQATNSFSVGNGAVTAAALDLRGARYMRQLQVGECVVTQTWYAHRARRELLVLDVTSEAPAADVCCSVEFVLNAGGASGDVSLSNATGAAGVLSGSTLEAEQDGEALVELAVATTAALDAEPWQACGNASLRHLTVVRTSLAGDAPDGPAAAAAEQLAAVQNQTADALFAEHAAAWAELWASGVDVEGNLTLARAVNASLYPILSGMRDDWAHGTGPCSAYVASYEQHVFWDLETYMLPNLMVLQPALAASALQYRVDRLAAAEANAARLGYEGAAYPWESGDTGAEVCKAIELGDQEQHISADIVLAMAKQWYATGDDEWLREQVWPVAKAVCAFWASRVVPAADGGNYTVLDVYPPDEAAGSVNSSVYTNVAAAMALDFCGEAAERLGEAAPAAWADIAARPYVPVDDAPDYFPAGRIHPEFAGYDGQQINQADVALLQYPLGFPMPADVAVNDLAYYQDNMPASGYYTGDSAYAVAWLGLGNRTAADDQMDLVFLHLGGPFNVWLERAYTDGNTNFLTGAGGFLQSMINGYGGVRVTRDCLQLAGTTLPGMGVEAMTLRRMYWRGVAVSVRVESADKVSVMAEGPGLALDGEPLEEGQWVSIESAGCVSAV